MKKGVYSVYRYIFALVCSLAFAAVGATSALATHVVYSGWNGDGIWNGGPTVETRFILDKPTNIAAIYNYHFNTYYGGGQNASQVDGTIGIDQIVSTTEIVEIGRWPANSALGIPNHRTWVVYPNILLGPGEYRVVDSDPATWSYTTTDSFPEYSSPDWRSGKGFSKIIATAGVTATSPVNNALNVALTQAVTITFNENIYAGTTLNQAEISYLNNGVRTVVSTTKSVSGNTLTITPNATYSAQTIYNVTLPEGCIKGVWPWVPSPAYQFSFKTGDQ